MPFGLSFAAGMALGRLLGLEASELEGPMVTIPNESCYVNGVYTAGTALLRVVV